MHYVGRVDWSFAETPLRLGDLVRAGPQVLVGPRPGAVHTELAVGAPRARAAGSAATSTRSRRRCTSSPAS